MIVSPTSDRRPGEESDADSSRETSSDGGSECGAERGTNHVQGAWSQCNNIHAMAQSFNQLSVDEGEISNPPGLLVFEYFESASPFSREPLADKIAVLASQFTQLKTCKSCELTPSSWISVAWYPIYRIPTGPTLQNLDACFLTFHSLSTPFTNRSSDSPPMHVPTARQLQSANMPLKLLLPIFGLASYKFKVSVWNLDGVHESQKVNSLLRAADNWLHLLQVDHPDYKFFVSHNVYMQ